MDQEPNKQVTVPILLLAPYGIIVVEVHEDVCTNSDSSCGDDSGVIGVDAMDSGGL